MRPWIFCWNYDYTESERSKSNVLLLTANTRSIDPFQEYSAQRFCSVVVFVERASNQIWWQTADGLVKTCMTVENNQT